MKYTAELKPTVTATINGTVPAKLFTALKAVKTP